MTDGPWRSQPPKAKLEEGEHIVQRVVEVSKLYDLLKGLSHHVASQLHTIADERSRSDYDSKGFTIDARLAHFVSDPMLLMAPAHLLIQQFSQAHGLNLAKTLSLSPSSDASTSQVEKEAVKDEIAEVRKEDSDAVERNQDGEVIAEEMAVPTS